MRIQRAAGLIAELDTLCSLASVAVNNNYCRPSVDDSGVIEIHDGRHPVVERVLKDALFVPNDTYMGEREDRAAIITGPNMAGKSTYMRQVALITLMAQIGSFVPAKSARIGVVDRIFTRIGASDDLAGGQSTFMVEMTEVSEILHQATPRSLLILDEIGRGTSTFDGMAIARAVLEYCADRKKLGAAGFCFAAAGAVCSALFCVFFGAVLGEYYSMADYPIAAAGSLADVVLFKRLDGAACAVWSMASAFRMGVMLFAAWSVIGEVLKCSRGASQPAPGKESCA